MSGRMTTHLLFPPLVRTGFGQIYPSTAYLSAFLKRLGLAVVQRDLNEDLAVQLMDPASLDRMGAGETLLGEPTSLAAPAAVAARLLRKNRARILPPDGKHSFQNPSGPGFLLNDLIAPLDRDWRLADLVAVLAGPVGAFYDQFFRHIDAANAMRSGDVVGISVAMGPQLVPSLALAAHLKRVAPDVRIVLGGPALSLLDDSAVATVLQSAPAVDAIVRYDGELPIASLCNQGARGQWTPWIVAGVSCRHDDQVVHVAPATGPRLETLPFGDFAPELVCRLQTPEFGITLSRGCYWGRCAYCDFVELYKGSPPLRMQIAQRVVQEMQYQIQRHGVRRFTLITEAIAPGIARRMCTAIAAAGLDVRWTSFAMVDSRFSAEDLRRMRESGCDGLVIGLETMNSRVLELVHKEADGEANSAFLAAAHDAGIPLYVNLIPDLPTTTYAEAMEALVSIRKLAPMFRSVAVFPFEATASSRLGRDPARYGLEVVHSGTSGGQAEFAANHLLVSDHAMGSEERADVHAAYRAFADEVAARSASSPPPPLGQSQPLRVAEETFDLVADEDALQLFHWPTRSRYRVHAGYGSLLDLVRHGDTIEELRHRIGESPEAGLLLGALSRYGLLVAIDA